MKAVCLFAVLVLAHILTLTGHHVPLSPWTPLAYFWQDILTALLFGVVDSFIRRQKIGWTLYGLLVVYVAVNVPIASILSSPLTWNMLRAARGPLSDSIAHYFTLRYIGEIVITCGAGILLPLVYPFVCQRLELRAGKGVAVAALAIAVVAAGGPFAAAKLDTAGMYRNAFGALWPAQLGGSTATGSEAWRTSPFPATPGIDLSAFQSAAAGRNVVVILLESTAARYLKTYGANEDPMPNLTRLAERSIVFENAYAVYPESIRELFSVLCSHYPAFGMPPDNYAAAPCTSLPELLKAAGYRTALFHSGRFMYLGMQSVVENHGFDTLEDAGAIGGNVNSSFGVDEPAAVGRMLSWIDGLPAGQRFFVTYIPVAGHHPYATPGPGPFAADTDIGRYRNALHYGDESLGTLFAGLRDRKLEDKTLFVIFGDHGEAFGQHDGNFGHSLFIYDENVRVPYIIAAPGLMKEQLRDPVAASVIDTAPTVLDLLGLPAPSRFQGSSLLNASPRMSLFFTDYSLGFLGLYDSCWKYIFETGSARSKLYNVCRDPDEKDDVSVPEAGRVTAYRSSVESWIAAQKGR